MMKISPLITGTLEKRYKRFLMDVTLPDGSTVTAHCPNSGSMKSLVAPGNTVYVEKLDDPTKKLGYKAHFIEADNGALSCVNTNLPNQMVKEWLISGLIPECTGFDEIKSEVRYGSEQSRIDHLLYFKDKPCFIEVKNVTLVEPDSPGVAQFPDAVTSRGTKHLRELAAEAEKGNRAVLFFVVNRDDATTFKVADHIDPAYAAAFEEARKKGVEILIYQSAFTMQGEEMEINRGGRLTLQQ